MADDVLFVKVACLIAFVDIPIPCNSGAAFNSELPSALLKSVLSKKSNTDEHSSLSNCIIGTSLIDPTPSLLLATVDAYQLPCEIIFLAPVPASAPAAGLTHIAC